MSAHRLAGPVEEVRHNGPVYLRTEWLIKLVTLLTIWAVVASAALLALAVFR